MKNFNVLMFSALMVMPFSNAHSAVTCTSEGVESAICISLPDDEAPVAVKLEKRAEKNVKKSTDKRADNTASSSIEAVGQTSISLKSMTSMVMPTDQPVNDEMTVIELAPTSTLPTHVVSHQNSLLLTDKLKTAEFAYSQVLENQAAIKKTEAEAKAALAAQNK